MCLTWGCVQEDITKALRAVHARFFLSRTTVNMALVGPGLVGGALLDQMQSQCCKLEQQYKLDVRVMAIATSGKVLLSQSGTWALCPFHSNTKQIILRPTGLFHDVRSLGAPKCAFGDSCTHTFT